MKLKFSLNTTEPLVLNVTQALDLGFTFHDSWHISWVARSITAPPRNMWNLSCGYRKPELKHRIG